METSASIEFPNNVLRPWKLINGVLTPVNGENTYFDFAKAIFYADTTQGIGYNVDIAGTLNPDYAEIGKTGLLLQINRLKLDLSKKRNIPEADYYGYSPDFVGVYARAVSVTFPPKWFHDDSSMQGNSTTTLRLGGYDLLVGTGGVTGTIMLESVPIATGGTSFEYYNDKFAFNYPITIYDTDPLTNEVVEVTVNNYQELKNILQQLTSSSAAPYPFKFPFSLTPVGQADPVVFDNPQNYQAYLATLNNNILWKKLGGPNGFQVGFTSFDVTLLKNSVVSSNIAGSLKIPKFKYPDNTPNVGGQPVQIDVTGHLDGNGDFLLTASTNPPFPIQFGNIFKLHLKSIELGKEENKFFIGASADLEFAGFLGELLEGQTISISTLRIYSDGRIDFRVNGGNLTLPKAVKLKLGPTELSVTAIHFGSHEREYKGKIRRYNYFGFDGGVSVGIAGIDARGDGIKYYYTIDDDEAAGRPHHAYLHIQTIYVDLVIPANSSDPNVMIKGWLSIPEPGEFPEYQGGVSLKLKNPRIAGGVDMRLAPKFPAFLLDANIELPNPIALGPVSLYGFRGLLGYRYVAEKQAIGMTSQNTWYQYYTAPQRGVNVRKFSRPDKTAHYNFPFSLGVGAIIGDTAALGTIISANAMLLLSLPSMVMVDARMKLLSERVTFVDDPPFFAFFIFGDHSLEFGFGADYKFPESSGDIIKLYAEIQAGFFFNSQSAWYINFGTKQAPITAKLLKDIFTLKAYVMISGKGIEAGARGEFRFDRKYGPVKVFVLAYLELGGRISFQRPQMGAYFEAGLAIDIDVKIISIYLAVTILLAVESPRPFLIYGAFMLEFKIKLIFFKLKFKVKVELKWEFNKDVDTTPVNPFTEIPAQTESLVKGISMLTNETFDLVELNPTSVANLDPATIKKVVPLDTYIDIKTTKGLLPTAATSALIGGYSNPAGNYKDLIPPEKVMKGQVLRQVKHQYSLESIEIKAHNGSSWVDYNPFKAMEPANTLLNGLKVGQWQKKDDQYNAIRLLGVTPFSYTEQGNPGWFIPEQYGINASTLFCEGEQIEMHISDFLDKPLNTNYYPSTNNFFQSKGVSYQILGDVQYLTTLGGTNIQGDPGKVSDEPNIFAFAKSLEFPNYLPLVLILPEASGNIELKLSTFSTGLTIAFYSAVNDPSQSFVQYNLVDELYFSKYDLQNLVTYNPPSSVDGITKIVITPEYEDMALANIIMQQMSVLMDQGYQIALQQGGTVYNVQPNNPDLYYRLESQLNEIRSRGCHNTKEEEKYEVVCTLYPELLKWYNNFFFQPFSLEQDDPEKDREIFAQYIRENLEKNNYGHVLEILQNTDVPTHIYEIYREQYARSLEELWAYANENPDDYVGIITRFETLKTTLKQLLKVLKRMNPCENQDLCSFSEYLSYQDYYNIQENYSPLLNAYYDFIKQHPEYGELNEILRRQLTIIALIIEAGPDAYYQNQQEYDTACQKMISIIADLGNCNDDKKCVTLFHEVKWLSVDDYIYNVNIPSQAAITQDAQAAVDAITKSVQPIWRPDTSYYIKFKLKDTVDDGVNHQEYEYAYGFRTSGPLGFFHLDKDSNYGDLQMSDPTRILEDTVGVIRDPAGNVVDSNQTPHPELYPHTNLRAYIDYQRSYPNADGNLVNAKPLFYDDITTKISLYFTSSYVSKLLTGWEPYNGMQPLGGTMKIIIKDPVEGIDIINPPQLDTTVQTIEQSAVDIPQTIEEWAQDDNPAIPPVLNQYFNMIKTNQCTGTITLVKPKSMVRIVTPKKLKPQKLYTAQILNFYWGTQTVNVSQITDDIKRQYAKEVHKFVFQTSRYKDFDAQVLSCMIPWTDHDGNHQIKQAVYSIEKPLDASTITAVYDTIKDQPNAKSESIALQYQHRFDRVIQGLLGLSPLNDATTTEFNKIIDETTGKVIAILIRNPEPFNHPKIPLDKINRNGVNHGVIEVITGVGAGQVDSNYSVLFSKDYSQAIIMNANHWIQESQLKFQFIYKIWNGTDYVQSKVTSVSIALN